MYICYKTKRSVPPCTPAEKVVTEVRRVTYTVMWTGRGHDVGKVVKRTEGWEITKEVIVHPKHKADMPKLEELIEKAKSQEPIERIQHLAKRPKWQKKGDVRKKRSSPTWGDKFKGQLKIVK